MIHLLRLVCLAFLATVSALNFALPRSVFAQPRKAGLDAAPGGPARLTNSVGMELILVQPGEFWSDDSLLGVRRRLIVPAPFYLGQCEVTQKQWEMVMGQNPSRFSGPDRPVEMVTWEDCKRFCERLSQMEGRKYRLPTFAEWQHACRAGTPGKWFFGDDETQVGEYAWYAGNCGATQFHENGSAKDGATQPVGTKKPNPWGFHDLYGNVSEWCADEYTGTHVGGDRGTMRLFCGSSYFLVSRCCWSGWCSFYRQSERSFILGFRVALDPIMPSEKAKPAAQPEPPSKER